MITGSMNAQTITANDVTIEKGGTADVTFTINSDKKAAIAEFKLELPEGITIQFDEDEDGYVYELGGDMTLKSHSATIKQQESGDFYVLVSNSIGKEFRAESGAYLTVTLQASEDAESGVARMKQIILGSVDAEQMNTESEYTFNITAVEVVGINTMTATTGDAIIFNMAGQRVKSAQRGLYIMNGKKMVVK